MTGRPFNDFWNYWRALNGLPPREPRPWPPEPMAPVQRPRRQRQKRPRAVIGHIESAEKPCRCGSTEFVIGEGKGPHAARLCCTACGRLRRWIGRRELASVAA